MTKLNRKVLSIFSLSKWNNEGWKVKNTSAWPYRNPEILGFLNPNDQLYALKIPPIDISLDQNIDSLSNSSVSSQTTQEQIQMDHSNVNLYMELFESKQNKHLPENLLSEYYNLVETTMNYIVDGNLKILPHVVTFRNNLNKLMGCIYHQKDAFEIQCQKIGNTLFLHIVMDQNSENGQDSVQTSFQQTQSQSQSQSQSQLQIQSLSEPENSLNNNINSQNLINQARSMYIGYNFEIACINNDSSKIIGNINSQILQANPTIGDSGANVLACSVLGSNLNIVLGAEIDVYDPQYISNPNNWRSIQKSIVELKTNKLLIDEKDWNNFRKFKALKIWIQCQLLGIKHALIGHHTNGVLKSINHLEMQQLSKDCYKHWSGKKCFHFTYDVLTWVGSFLKEGESCTLKYNTLNRTLELIEMEETLLSTNLINQWKEIVNTHFNNSY